MRPALARILALLLLLTGATTAGPLDPPAAPAPTDGVRGPGTPISSLPFAITQAGYYYVTRTLTVPGSTDGITISASNVTLDLGGFTLLGNGTGLNGVNAVGGIRNVTVRNGAARSWGVGFNLGGATQSLVERVQASNNSSTGISISVHSEVRDCNASLNFSNGIFVTKGVVRNCVVTENNSVGIFANGSTYIVNTLIAANGSIGVNLAPSGNVLRDSVFAEPGTGGYTDVFIGGTGNLVQNNRVCTTLNVPGGNTQFDNTLQSC